MEFADPAVAVETETNKGNSQFWGFHFCPNTGKYVLTCPRECDPQFGIVGADGTVDGFGLVVTSGLDRLMLVISNEVAASVSLLLTRHTGTPS